MTSKAFQKAIFSYYKTHKRHLPWRETTDPYKILVSEIMLQQTQATRVIAKYEEWLKHFPNFKILAAASLQEVLSHWHGLGYNRRALALKRAAEAVTEKYAGKLPAEYEKILELPGIGPYTAGAIMAFAFNKPFPIIETNIRTVYIYFFFKNHGQVHDKELLPIIEKTLATNNVREWYYALMDYGAMLKKTVGNVSTRSKHYTKQSTFKGSHRELRALILRLITKEPRTEKNIIKMTEREKENIKAILFDLKTEGFIKKVKSVYYIQ